MPKSFSQIHDAWLEQKFSPLLCDCCEAEIEESAGNDNEVVICEDCHKEEMAEKAMEEESEE